MQRAPWTRWFFALSDPVRRARSWSGWTVMRRCWSRSWRPHSPFRCRRSRATYRCWSAPASVTQTRSGRISRCSLDAAPLADAAAVRHRYAKYWQAQFETLDQHLIRIEKGDAMTCADTLTELMNKRARMEALRQEMRALQANIEPQPVKDYELQGWAGP